MEQRWGYHREKVSNPLFYLGPNACDLIIMIVVDHEVAPRIDTPDKSQAAPTPPTIRETAQSSNTPLRNQLSTLGVFGNLVEHDGRLNLSRSTNIDIVDTGFIQVDTKCKHFPSHLVEILGASSYRSYFI